ncbi:hypothetical protein NE865_14369 [Phthorimaea operculella]|nr:hypothetical protein NE865_14369 [Phthorimaea operculella]
MAGTMALMTMVDSVTELLQSTGEGLPPEKVPFGRLFSTVCHDDWGKASIYDPEPELEPAPERALPEISKSITRKSLLAHPKLSDSGRVSIKEEESTKLSSELSETTEEDVIFWYLPFFQSSMMATIIEDTITQLRILSECNNVLRIMKALADMPLLLALKFDIKQKPKDDELEGIDQDNLGCTEYKLNKLVADRHTIINMFINLYVELSTEKSFITILDFITAIQDREAYAIRLEEEELKNRVLRKDLAKQLRQQRNHHKTLAYDSDQLIAALKSEVEDAGLISETKGRYIDNWQAARTEQHKQLIQEDESVFIDSTEYYKRRSDHESRVHAEVESLTNIAINEALKSIEHWMEKYDHDTEKLDLKIQIQKSEYQNMLDKRTEMEDLYAKHDKEIKEWVKFKEEREKERQYANKMNQSAITVQAWWRGLLVRKQLGPYRKRKRRKK